MRPTVIRHVQAEGNYKCCGSCNGYGIVMVPNQSYLPYAACGMQQSLYCLSLSLALLVTATVYVFISCST